MHSGMLATTDIERIGMNIRNSVVQVGEWILPKADL